MSVNIRMPLHLEMIHREILACEAEIRAEGIRPTTEWMGADLEETKGVEIKNLIDEGKMESILKDLEHLHKGVDALRITQLGFAVHKEAFVQTLQLRAQAVTMCSIIENFRATHAYLTQNNPDWLSEISAHPLTIKDNPQTIKQIITSFIQDINSKSLDPPPAPVPDTEDARAIRSTLVRQRRLAVRQIVELLVSALQLAEEREEKGV